MDFELTDEQRQMVDSTRSLLANKSSVSRTRELVDNTAGFDDELWRYGTDIGWPALAIAEDDGGLGQQAIDLALIAVELGYGLATTPFVPTVVAAEVIGASHSPDRARILADIAEGSLVATWAFAESGQTWGASAVSAIGTIADRHEGGYRLNGAKVAVQDADGAQLLIVDAVADGAPARFVVPAGAPGVTIRRQHTLDVARSLCDVTFDNVAVDESALLASGGESPGSFDRALALNTVLVCAELVGIGQRLLDMTVEYVKARVQFGRPVGSFQAVKHKCADMRIWVQGSTAATYFAAMTLDDDHPDAERAVSVAKAYTSDAINRVAGQALQLHGGIGFTWEHDLHLFMRRARANSLLAGDVRHHREVLCSLLEGA